MEDGKPRDHDEEVEEEEEEEMEEELVSVATTSSGGNASGNEDEEEYDAEATAAFDEEDDEEEDEEEDEEARLESFPLPPLPPPSAPPAVHGVNLGEVYSIIKELRRQLDDPVERERAKTMLKGDTNVLLAVAQVLQEAKLLRRSVVNEQTGHVEEQQVPQPLAPFPQLPAGYKSWIVEEQPNKQQSRRR